MISSPLRMGALSNAETVVTVPPAPAATFAASIGRVARRIRKLRGLTLVRVSQRAGVSPSLLSRLETGDVTASLETIVALAAALGVHPAMLLQEVEARQVAEA